MTELAAIRRTFRSFRRVGWRRRGLILEAWLWLALARLALALVPFPTLARRLGVFAPPTDPRIAAVAAAGAETSARLAREVGWAVTRGAVHAPFRAVCLPQAMAARIMLRRRGVASVLHFGAALGEGSALGAHAWLDAAGVKVTGYPLSQTVAEMACFV